jgi:hypothetical protein
LAVKADRADTTPTEAALNIQQRTKHACRVFLQAFHLFGFFKGISAVLDACRYE